jgi:hypothetical protein
MLQYITAHVSFGFATYQVFTEVLLRDQFILGCNAVGFRYSFPTFRSILLPTVFACLVSTTCPLKRGGATILRNAGNHLSKEAASHSVRTGKGKGTPNRTEGPEKW